MRMIIQLAYDIRIGLKNTASIEHSDTGHEQIEAFF
jgi:hypothetical protein